VPPDALPARDGSWWTQHRVTDPLLIAELENESREQQRRELADWLERDR
jgi:hypothetical protein